MEESSFEWHSIYLHIEGKEAGLAKIWGCISGSGSIRKMIFWQRFIFLERRLWRELKIDGEGERGDEDGEEKGDLEAVPGVDGAGGDDDHDEENSSHGNRAGEENIPKEET